MKDFPTATIVLYVIFPLMVLFQYLLANLSEPIYEPLPKDIDIHNLSTGTIIAIESNINKVYHYGVVVHLEDMPSNSYFYDIMSKHSDARIIHFNNQGGVIPDNLYDNAAYISRFLHKLSFLQKSRINIANINQFCGVNSNNIVRLKTNTHNLNHTQVGLRAVQIFENNHHQYMLFYQNCQHLAMQIALGFQLSVTIHHFYACSIWMNAIWIIGFILFVPHGLMIKKLYEYKRVIHFINFILKIIFSAYLLLKCIFSMLEFICRFCVLCADIQPIPQQENESWEWECKKCQHTNLLTDTYCEACMEPNPNNSTLTNIILSFHKAWKKDLLMAQFFAWYLQKYERTRKLVYKQFMVMCIPLFFAVLANGIPVAEPHFAGLLKLVGILLCCYFVQIILLEIILFSIPLFIFRRFPNQNARNHTKKDYFKNPDSPLLGYLVFAEYIIYIIYVYKGLFIMNR